MLDLAYKGMEIDLELRKKLIELLDLRKKLIQAKKEDTNPIKQQEIIDNIHSIDELIGKIRYSSLDEMGIIHKGEK